MAQGIYEIVNLRDGKASTYIGSSSDVTKRWKQHRYQLRAGRHANAHLQAAWNKYGEDAFLFSLLEEVKDSALWATEQEYLDDYFDRGNCYNIAITAGPTGPKSEEHKQKIRATQKQRRARKRRWEILEYDYGGHIPAWAREFAESSWGPEPGK